MKQSQQIPNRRTVLKTLGVGALTGLAGCGGGSSTSSGGGETGTAAATSAGAINSISVEKAEVKVDLKNPDEIEVVKALNPDGSGWKEQTVEQQTSVSFGLLGDNPYTPGSLRFTVEDDKGETIGEGSSPLLKPELSIEEIGIAADRPDLGWNKDNPQWGRKVYVTVSNTGTGPEEIRSLEFEGVPGAGTTIGSPSGIEQGSVAVLPGESAIVRSAAYAFGGWSGSSTSCDTEDLPHSFTTRLSGSIGGEMNTNATVNGTVNESRLNWRDDPEDVKLDDGACEITEVKLTGTVSSEATSEN